MTTRISFVWGKAGNFNPSQTALDNAETDIQDEVPSSVRDDWADGLQTQLSPDSNGRVDLATMRTYIAARLVELNNARPSGADAISLTGGSSSPPAGMIWVFKGGEKVAVNLFPLNLGSSAWEPPVPSGETAEQVLIRVTWD